MNRLSGDPFEDSESWNGSDLYRDCVHYYVTYIDVGSIAPIICRLDLSASFEI